MVRTTADLSVDKEVLRRDPVTGAVIYQVKVTNNGPETAFDTIVSDSLSPGGIFDRNTLPRTGCRHADSDPMKWLKCSLGDMPPGETRILTYGVLPDESGTIENAAWVSATYVNDPNKDNNEDTLLIGPAPEPITLDNIQSATKIGSVELDIPQYDIDLMDNYLLGVFDEGVAVCPPILPDSAPPPVELTNEPTTNANICPMGISLEESLPLVGQMGPPLFFLPHQRATVAKPNPDGTQIATGALDGTVKVWDITTGQPVHTFQTDPTGKNTIWGLMFSPDGKTLAAIGNSTPTEKAEYPDEVFLWNLDTGESRVLQGNAPIMSMGFSPDGNTLVTGGMAPGLSLWDPNTGALLSTIPEAPPVIPENRTAFVWTADGQLVSASVVPITKFDLATGSALWQYVPSGEEGGGGVYNLTRSSGGDLILASGSGLIALDAATGQKVATLATAAPGETIIDMALNAQGNALVTLTSRFDENNNFLNMRMDFWGYNAATSGQVATLAPITVDNAPSVALIETLTVDQKLSGFDFTPYNSLFLGPGGAVLCGPVNNPSDFQSMCRLDQLKPTATLEKRVPRQQPLPESIWLEGAFPTSGVLRPDGAQAATGYPDGTVKLWDAATGENLSTLPAHRASVWNLTFSPDSAILASAGLNNPAPEPPGAPDEIRLWDAATGAEIRVLQGPESIFSLAFSPDGRLLVAGGGLSDIWVWDVTTGGVVAQIVHTPDTVNDIVNDVSFTPDGALLAAASFEHLKLYDTTTWQPLQTISDLGAVKHIALTADGSLMITGGDELSLLETATGSKLNAFYTLTERELLFGLATTADDTLLVTLIMAFDEADEPIGMQLGFWGAMHGLEGTEETPPPVTEEVYTASANGNVNLRTGPGTTYDTVGSATPADEILILGRNTAGDWLKVRVGDIEAWLFASLVTTDAEIAALPVVE